MDNYWSRSPPGKSLLKSCRVSDTAVAANVLITAIAVIFNISELRLSYQNGDNQQASAATYRNTMSLQLVFLLFLLVRIGKCLIESLLIKY